ncbi:phenylalanine--tRNA ligase subunit beta [Candidatus Woesearchaeota archaeon]|nr:phenylalanine--tRNA ligase subunit beta [Candidatus Woesearchaeota archaeon]
MPQVTINRRVFEKLVGKKLSDEELKDRISMIGTDLEEVNDKEIIVEIFPNRPDMLSEQGFARAFSTFVGASKGISRFKIKDSNEQMIIENSVKNVRPFTACAIIKGMKFNDEKIREVIQIQEKLHITYGRNRKKVAMGIYPYEKIKPPIRFVALKPEEIRFVPLEYDREMNGRQILTTTSTGKEFAHLLEGLDKYPVFIDSEDKILSMPPILNSHETGKITEKTKDVFIECSGFDYYTLSKCLNILVTAMHDMGGEIYSMDLVYPDTKKTSPNLSPSKMKLDYKYINRVLGLDLTKNDIEGYLEKMGYGIESKNVLIPCYRTDILHPIDIVEDVAIAYGYENFEAVIPNVSTVAAENPFEVFKRRISTLLAGLGYIETSSYHITNCEQLKQKMNCENNFVALANALTSEYDTLRSWMIPSLMAVLANNKHYEYPQDIFEIGTIFKKGNTETGVIENDRLAICLCGEDRNYTKIKQVMDYIFSNLGKEYSISETEHGSFIEGRVGRVSYKGKDLAYMGEINPIVLDNFEIQMPVAALELNLTELFKLIK